MARTVLPTALAKSPTNSNSPSSTLAALAPCAEDEHSTARDEATGEEPGATTARWRWELRSLMDYIVTLTLTYASGLMCSADIVSRHASVNNVIIIIKSMH